MAYNKNVHSNRYYPMVDNPERECVAFLDKVRDEVDMVVINAQRAEEIRALTKSMSREGWEPPVKGMSDVGIMSAYLRHWGDASNKEFMRFGITPKRATIIAQDLPVTIWTAKSHKTGIYYIWQGDR